MAKARAFFGRLRQSLWNNHDVSMRVKDNIYRAIVLFTLLLFYDFYENSEHTTGRKAVSFRDATSVIDHEDNLDGQSDKQGHT